MGRDATYVVRAAGAAASRVDVNGPATINGSKFDAMVGSAAQLAALGQRYTVLTASDGVGGEFGAVTGNLGSAASQYPFLTRGGSRLCARRGFARPHPQLHSLRRGGATSE
jgi:subtilase-type serine protease